MRTNMMLLAGFGLAGFFLLHFALPDNLREKKEGESPDRAAAKPSNAGDAVVSLRSGQISDDLVAKKGAGDQEKRPESDQASEGYRFADDPSGKILSKLLPPSEKAGQLPSGPPAKPRRLPAPASLEHPTAPLPSAQVEVPRLPSVRTSIPKPRPLPEEMPILGGRLELVMPQGRTLPADDRVRLPSVDPRQPLPLPDLAQPTIDRAFLDDETSDASQAAALAAQPPARTAPAPFMKTTLPDPFENRLREVAFPEPIAPPRAGPR
ncbi:MAG: hypothetical protein ACJ8FY_00990 [Gemmataceae bacterium]